VAVNVARKAPVIFGLLLSVSIIRANYVDSNARIIFFMAITHYNSTGHLLIYFYFGQIERITEGDDTMPSAMKTNGGNSAHD
jgi:hypothetical protein